MHLYNTITVLLLGTLCIVAGIVEITADGSDYTQEISNKSQSADSLPEDAAAAPSRKRRFLTDEETIDSIDDTTEPSELYNYSPSSVTQDYPDYRIRREVDASEPDSNETTHSVATDYYEGAPTDDITTASDRKRRDVRSRRRRDVTADEVADYSVTNDSLAESDEYPMTASNVSDNQSDIEQRKRRDLWTKRRRDVTELESDESDETIDPEMGYDTGEDAKNDTTASERKRRDVWSRRKRDVTTDDAADDSATDESSSESDEYPMSNSEDYTSNVSDDQSNGAQRKRRGLWTKRRRDVTDSESDESNETTDPEMEYYTGDDAKNDTTTSERKRRDIWSRRRREIIAEKAEPSFLNNSVQSDDSEVSAKPVIVTPEESSESHEADDLWSLFSAWLTDLEKWAMENETSSEIRGNKTQVSTASTVEKRSISKRDVSKRAVNSQESDIQSDDTYGSDEPWAPFAVSDPYWQEERVAELENLEELNEDQDDANDSYDQSNPDDQSNQRYYNWFDTRDFSNDSGNAS